MAQVGIVMGSDSDMPIMAKAADILDQLGVSYEMTIISAHREPDVFFEYAKSAEKKGFKVIIAGAGMAAHLPGMCAAIFPMPVIGIPMHTTSLGGRDSLYSIVQMPTGIPVATVAINGGANAGILAAKILATSDADLLARLKEYSKNLKEQVEAKDARLQEVGSGQKLREGIFHYVKSLTADCDFDTILAKVSQVGAACHTGNRTCFFNSIVQKEYVEKNPLKVLESVYDIIKERKAHPQDGSYTNYLFGKGTDKILQKLGEECTEIVIAAKNPEPENIKYEISDFLYHCMVLMVEKGITWEEIANELAQVCLFHHKHHTVIQKIGNLTYLMFSGSGFFAAITISRTLFPKFLQNLIGSFPKQIIGIGTILRMCFTFLDNIIHALKYLQRIFLNILFLYDAIEKTGTVSGVTGSPYLGDFCQNRIKVAVSRQGFDKLKMPWRARDPTCLQSGILCLKYLFQ